jgi:glycosyltransferase involved in cell wall biosynthesis
MKILHIIPSLNPNLGGVCKAVRDIIYGLEKGNSNFTNEVLCLDSPDEKYIKNEQFKVHALGDSKTSWSYSKTLLKWLYNFSGNYDQIIVHGLWQYQSYAIYKAWQKYQFKYYVMPHGMLDPYFQKAPERKLKAIRNIFFWKYVEKKLINNSYAILFTCNLEKELARTTFNGYNAKKEFVIGLGVAPPPQYNQQSIINFNNKFKIDDKYLLFLSRIDHKKGIDILLKAYQMNIDKIPYKLIVAGPLDSLYAQNLIKTYQSENIIFTGMLQGDEKWAAIYGANLFILPSHQENFGIAIVEAMACGKPVAITRQVNIYDVIENCNAGFVFDDNYESICEALKEISDTSIEDMNKKGNIAKDAYLKNYLPEIFVENLIKYLDPND